MAAVDTGNGDLGRVRDHDLGADLPDHADDRAVTAAAYDAGVIVRPLASYYSVDPPPRRGLLLGYACVANEKIGPAFDTRARVIEQTALKAPTRAA